MRKESLDESDDWVEDDDSDTESMSDDDNDSGDDDDHTETIVLDAKAVKSGNVGLSSVEINVEQLLAEVEAEASHGVDKNGRVRRRLEAIMERKRRHRELVDFDEYDIDS